MTLGDQLSVRHKIDLWFESRQYSVLFFRDLKHAPNAPAHFWISVAINDRDSLLICMITSKVQKSLEVYGRRTDQRFLNSTIQIDGSDFNFLNRPSLIDCNQANLYSKDELVKRIDSNYPCNKRASESDFGIELKRKIAQAVLNSPQVSPRIKKMLIA